MRDENQLEKQIKEAAFGAIKKYEQLHGKPASDVRWVKLPFSIVVPVIDFVVYDTEIGKWTHIEYEVEMPRNKIEKRIIYISK